MLSFIGRAGILVRPNTLVYGLVGPTEGHFTRDTGEAQTANRNVWQLGVSAGGGIEHKFNSNWSFIAEYRYLHFNVDSAGSTGSASFLTNTSSNTTATNKTAVTAQTHVGVNVGKIGIVYRIT